MKTQLKDETTLAHVLFARTIRPITDWAEWLTRWETAISIEEMLGLLHVGFNVPLNHNRPYDAKKYGRADRIIFYMSIADGWSDAYELLRKPGESSDSGEFLFGRDKYGEPERKSEYQLRHLLALKAFDMLCANFFKPRERRDEQFREWENLVVTDELFPALRNFFKVGTRFKQIVIRNMGRNDVSSNNGRIVIEFMRDLTAFLWDWHEEPIESWQSSKDKEARQASNKAMRARIEPGKVWMVEVLAHLGELHALQKFILSLDKTCLGKLREIAMRNEIDRSSGLVVEDRPVASLDEGCLIGSAAAWFLKRHELVIREHARLMQVKSAHEDKIAAERTIAKLTAAA